MGWNGRRFLFLFCFFWISWRIKAFQDGVCDEFFPSVYCTCDTRRSETSVVCYITGKLNVHDDIWRSIARVEDMNSLTIYSMEGVNLTYLPIQSLRESNSLRMLEVKQATLGSLKPLSVSGLIELRELKLNGVEIMELESKAISNFPKLRVLSLSENSLQEILADSFVGLDELEHLFLDKNNISRVESCAFCALQNLKDLELWGNQITDLSDYMFRGLRFLVRLDLYKNRIRVLNDKVFHSMPKLVEIDLKDNLISYISPNAFQGLKHLQRLMLNSNKIKLLPDNVFKPLSNLRTLDLYNNELETLQLEVFESLEKVKEAHFTLSFKDNNPLLCDCRLDWVRNVVIKDLVKSHQLSSELKELQCKYNSDEQERHVVHLLKMDCGGSSGQSSVQAPSYKSASVPPNNFEKQGNARTTPHVSDDDQAEEAAEKIEHKDNGSILLAGDIRLLVCVTLFTISLVIKRKNFTF